MALTIPKTAKIDNIVAPKADSKWWAQFVTGVTFNATPAWTDVAQGQINNCYVLAPLIAIAKQPKGPAFLADMLADADASFVGRLYDTAGRTRYIKAKKALCVMKSASGAPATATSPHSALWVSAIEIMMTCFKAVSASEAVYDPDNASYARLSMGKPSLALQLLTGQPSLALNIPDPKAGMQYSATGSPYRQAYALFNLGNNVFEQFQHLVERGFTLLPSGVSPASQTYLTTNAAALRALWHAFLGRRQNKTLRREDYTNDFLDKLYAQFVIPADSRWIFDDVAKDLSGVRASAAYSPGDLHVYTTVKSWVDGGKAVVASTRPNAAPDIVGTGGASPTLNGLVLGHSYAVTGLADSNTSAHKLVQLVNPWGKTVRSYSGGKPFVHDADGAAGTKGLFTIPLADFTKRFEVVHASGVSFA